MKLNKPMTDKLKRAYGEMIESFASSQETLDSARFSVMYDTDTNEIIEYGADANNNAGIDDAQRNLQMISYFSDFVIMQQLMTLEVDIIIG